MRKLALLSVFVIAFVAALDATAQAATINCSHVGEFCEGTNVYDAIYGWDNTNIIHAKGGDDDVWAYPGNDWVAGEGENDNLNGGEGFDTLYGENGHDNYLVVGNSKGLFGGIWADELFGGEGRDLVQGDGGKDTLYGNTGADTFYAEDGNADYVNGNEGQSPYVQPCYVDGYDTWVNCEPH